MRSDRVTTLAMAMVMIGAPVASAQRVLLQIRPHVGDTIKMRLTQTVEMTGKMRRESGDSTTTMTTSTEIFSRAVPFQWTPGGTLIHAITDSVTAGPGGSATLAAELRRKAVPKTPAVLRVAADGAIEVVDDGDPNSEVRHLFAEMPAVLPRKSVSVGERWTKEMRIPLSGDPGSEGTVKAVLQLDSLSANGEMAYISIRGTLSRVIDSSGRAGAKSYDASGTFTGSIQIDRALGWITDARSVISVKSEMGEKSVASPSRRSNRPVEVNTKVSSWTRAVKVR